MPGLASGMNHLLIFCIVGNATTGVIRWFTTWLISWNSLKKSPKNLMILLILEEFHFYNMSVFRNYGVFLQNNFGITQHNSVQNRRTIKKNWRKIREIEWTRKNSISRENYVLSFYSGMYKIHLKFANNSFKDNLMPLSSMPNDSGHFAGICGGK